MKTKRIISLLLALVICVGSVLSLSSCMQFFEYFLYEDDNSQEGGDIPQPPNNNSGSSDSNEPPEFYPGSSETQTPIENISLMSRALLSCVSVYSTFEISYGYPSSITESATSRGSGVIYKLNKETGDAYIITNYHVVYHSGSTTSNKISNNIKVYLYGQELTSYAIPATYVGGSMANDIAVLRVTGSEVLKNSQALAAYVADSDDIAVFDSVTAIGNPEGRGISATNGIVSVDSEKLDMTGADDKTPISPRVIRISAAINDGNSGGGLFNANGQLVGIVNAKRNGSNIDNIAYAIPSNVATRLAENIILFCDGASNTTPKKAMLGVTLTAKVMGTIVDEDGRVIKGEIVEISELTDTSAVKYSIEVGDRINSITVGNVTKTVTRIHHVVDMMLLARVGDAVTLNVTRGTQTFDISIIVTEAMFTDV